MQTLAQHMRQWAVVRATDIGHLDTGRIGFCARTHCAHNRNTTVERTFDQSGFGRQRVDSVNDIVVVRRIEDSVGLLVADISLNHIEL